VQLQQVMLNLIMNAIEAMSSVTGRERRLTKRTSRFLGRMSTFDPKRTSMHVAAPFIAGERPARG
jgi:nitrogen-specific signal transduction histidine kinase